MSKNSLDLVDPQLSKMVGSLTATQLRAVVLAACKLALVKTGQADEVVREGLRALERGDYADAELSSRLQRLVDLLDEKAWDVQDLVEEGQSVQAAYSEAFARARAANALLTALASSTSTAAVDALYESSFALEDPHSLRLIVEDVQGRCK